MQRMAIIFQISILASVAALRLTRVPVNGQKDGCDAVIDKLLSLSKAWRSDPVHATGPVLHYAFYDGQGFGRLLEHSRLTMLFAAALGRPFLLDLHTRDPDKVWQQFFEHGVMDWTPPDSMDVAFYKSLFKGLQYATPFENVTLPKELLPMQSFEDELALWEGSNPETKSKILYSPNWGLSWFGKGVESNFIQKRLLDSTNCHESQLQTALYKSNILFKPTQKALSMFDDRRRDVLGTEFQDSNKYGAIHLRTLMTTEKWQDKGKELLKDLSKASHKVDQKVVSVHADHVELADGFAFDLQNPLHVELVKSSIEKCTKHFPDINTWWLILDDVQEVPKFMNAMPNLKHGYTPDFIKNNAHSDSDKAKSDVQLMAPSVMDFLTIFQSAVSMTTGGAFGGESAMGNGKLPDHFGEDCLYWRVSSNNDITKM